MKCSCANIGGIPCKSCGCINNPMGPGHRANGDVCGNSVVPGTHKCHMHGGSTPQAKLKAEQAMALLRMPGIEAMHEILETMMQVVRQFGENTCPTCGYPKGDTDEIHAVSKVAAVVVRQVQTILDRTGIPARATLEVKQSDGDLDLRALTEQERGAMIALFAQLRELKEAARARINGALAPPSTLTH